MKFRATACPKPYEGVVFKSKSQVVPNQSMSLQEILERFTRNEALPIGRDVQYDEGDEDLEKIQHMDMVDKQEFIDKQVKIRKAHESQEKLKAKQRKQKLEQEEREKIARELREQSSGAGKGPGPGPKPAD